MGLENKSKWPFSPFLQIISQNFDVLESIVIEGLRGEIFVDQYLSPIGVCCARPENQDKMRIKMHVSWQISIHPPPLHEATKLEILNIIKRLVVVEGCHDESN